MPINKWTREELILAFNLYFKIPFGKIDDRTPEIISLAKILDRTPSAVALKLANFARLVFCIIGLFSIFSDSKFNNLCYQVKRNGFIQREFQRALT